jgi:hypothetical protein
MTGGQASNIAKLRRDNDMETLVGHGEFALLPQTAESGPGGYRIGPQSVIRRFGAETVSPPCDQTRYEFCCSHELPSQMNYSGKATHFVTLVERYLWPASVVIPSNAAPVTSSMEELKNPAIRSYRWAPCNRVAR